MFFKRSPGRKETLLMISPQNDRLEATVKIFRKQK